jgi:Flp pilus assembly protein TadD
MKWHPAGAAGAWVRIAGSRTAPTLRHVPLNRIMSIACFLRRVLLLALASVAAIALAQAPPVTQDPRDMGEAARKVYAQGLREARDLIDRKQYEQAIARLDALSQERPREPQARFMKGIALSDQGKVDEAITVFRTVLAEYPELPEPRNNLAVLYAQKGEYALARDELERAIQTAPDYAVAHENLGDVYARLAAVEYERTVELDKRNRTAAAKLKQVREIQSPSK